MPSELLVRVKESRAFRNMLYLVSEFHLDLRDVEGAIATGRPQPNAMAQFLERLSAISDGLHTLLDNRERLSRKQEGPGPWRKAIQSYGDLVRAIERIPVPNETLASRLSLLLNKGHLTAYALAQQARIDGGYAYRLANGQRENPNREMLDRIASALSDASDEISASDIRELYRALALDPPSRYQEPQVSLRKRLLLRLFN